MQLDQFVDLLRAGLHPIPIQWNEATKQATEYPEHSIVTPNTTESELLGLWADRFSKCNGLAVKLFPPFFMVDFDMKNTNDKTIYDKWLNAVCSQMEDFTSKVCIERTRNGGYHVYCKYSGIRQKQTLAKSDTGAEVISNYTGGLLSFCHPTPGYEIISGSLSELEELTEDEFDVMNTISLSFNAYTQEYDYSKHIVTTYPIEYETMALHFDRFCNDWAFEEMLNDIGLFEIKGQRRREKDKHLKYLRKGSTADYSAKVYYAGKKLLLFTSSIPDFPSFHSRVDEHDHSWVLTPTLIAYYGCKGNWLCAIDRIKDLAERHGIQLESYKPIESVFLPADRLRFPMDIFPIELSNYIAAHRNIQHEYMGAFMLAAVASTIGNSVKLRAGDNWDLSPVLYMVVVAPPGASKTPAMSKAFRYLRAIDDIRRKAFGDALKEYEQLNRIWEDGKKKGEEPEKPNCEQIIIEDSTIEMVVKILTNNKEGCCVYADELSGFINRMNRYEKSDEVQKWLSIWSCQTLLLQRITREDNYIKDPFCCIAGGIQPGVLEILSKDQNGQNGFFHRFLFCYPDPQPKPEWERVRIAERVIQDYDLVFSELMSLRFNQRRVIEMTAEAEAVLARWYNAKCAKYNKAYDDNIKGIIAKYQEYCLRFALLIEIMNNPAAPVVEASSMEKATRLTEYFLGNIHKAMQILAPETPVDKLPAHYKKLYNALPALFTLQTAQKAAEEVGVKVGTLKSFLSRNKALFTIIDRGSYEKNY